RVLSKTQSRHRRFLCCRFHPIEPVGLRVETGGSVSRRVKNLVAQRLRYFYWLKDLNSSPMKNRFQNVGHGSSMLLLQHNGCCNSNMFTEAVLPRASAVEVADSS